MNEYVEMANNFVEKHGVTLDVLGSEYRPFWDEKQPRWVFKLRLRRNGKSHTFEFGQSIADGSAEPEMYDVLACLTKYDPDDFEWFCSNYGYDTDSRRAERTYKAVCREWAAVERLFGDVLDELREIS